MSSRRMDVWTETAEQEDARFRTIIQTTTDAIVIVDEEGDLQFANRAAETLFGRTCEQLVGHPFGFPVVPGGTTEIDIRRPDGTIAVAELKAAAVPWEGRDACLASMRDITERRVAEQRERELIREQAARAAAEASERRARFLSEAGDLLAESFDYTDTLRRVASLTVPFLADACIVDVLNREGDIQRITAGLSNADGSGVSTDDSVATAPRVLRTGKSELIDHTMVIPLIARGRPLGTLQLMATTRAFSSVDLAFAEELARRAAIAMDNARLYQEAQQANNSKSDFLAVMSHELRTPLNAVIGYADLLLMGLPAEVPAAAKSQVVRIRGAARHLLGLIEEILTFARLESGREDLHVQYVDVSALLTEAVTMMEPIAAAKTISLSVRRPETPVTLRTDPQKLQQILLNLLTNAIKFTDPGGEVGLAFDHDDAMAEFSVWDSGIGIPPDALSQIFEPFWQAEQSRTRTVEGTGLGLSVARRLARLLGGDIHVDSKQGVGSRFSVRIARSLPVPSED